METLNTILVDIPRRESRTSPVRSGRKKNRDFIIAKDILARNVLRRRQALGLTQTDASDLVGMCWRHWQKIEAGEVNVTIFTLTRLAKALQVKLPDLLVL